MKHAEKSPIRYKLDQFYECISPTRQQKKGKESKSIASLSTHTNNNRQTDRRTDGQTDRQEKEEAKKKTQERSGSSPGMLVRIESIITQYKAR